MSTPDILAGVRAEPQPIRGGLATAFGATMTLTMRELIRYARQPSRVVASLGTSVLIWIFLGSGFAASFASPHAPSGAAMTDPASTQTAMHAGSGSYGLHLLPGMLALTVVFSSVFGSISLIDDRNEGFLQSVLVSPTPRWALVASKLFGGSLLAMLQGVLLLPGVYLLGARPGPLELLEAIAALACASLGVTALGLALAWRINSVQGFHGVMNLVLMPMWLLAGTLFPIQGASVWLKPLMLADPLTWPSEALRHALTATPTAASLSTTWLLTLLFPLLASTFAWLSMRGRAN